MIFGIGLRLIIAALAITLERVGEVVRSTGLSELVEGLRGLVRR